MASGHGSKIFKNIPVHFSAIDTSPSTGCQGGKVLAETALALPLSHALLRNPGLAPSISPRPLALSLDQYPGCTTGDSCTPMVLLCLRFRCHEGRRRLWRQQGRRWTMPGLVVVV
jgi:hypothetical protein